MTEYLFSRTDLHPGPTIVEHEGMVFFDLWKTRQDPFAVLEEGDTMWWVDQADRRIRLELRVANLLTAEYSSLDGALQLLRQAYGLFPEDLTAYAFEGKRPTQGQLLAWSADIAAQVDVALPAGVHLGRNGYRRLDADLTAELRAAGLPEPATVLLVPSPPWMHTDGLTSPLSQPPRRYIPVPVRRQVLARDGATCQQCGRSELDVPLHLDHIHPFSRGGTNEADNLQVLCIDCNLAKGATPGDGGVAHSGSRALLGELARLLGRPLPDDDAGIPALIAAGVAAGHAEQAVDAAVAVYRHPGATDELVRDVVDALAEVPPPLDGRVECIELTCFGDDAELLAAAERWITSPDPITAAAGALQLVDVDVDDERADELLAIALACDDPVLAGEAELFRLARLAGDEDRDTDELVAEIIDGLRALAGTDVAGLRAEASYHLAALLFEERIGIDPIDDVVDEALRYAKQALAADDPDDVARACILLSDITGVWSTDLARRYAEHARAIAHDVALLIEVDDRLHELRAPA